MPPPWMRHPGITSGSVGWRMGHGEDYAIRFSEWLRALSAEDRAKYQEMFPAPKTWVEYYNDDYDFEDIDEYECEGVELWEKGGAMRYGREQTVERLDAGEAPDYVFFWKPRANALDEACLGQWQASDFAVDGEKYRCAEQYMMSEKARVFADREIRAQIMRSESPKGMKALGKKVRGFDGARWDRVKYAIVLNGNYHKFAQNAAMRDFLLSTGDRILVEASPLDAVWGIGIGAEDPKARNPRAWRGQNLLGFALMEVRDELRAVYRNHDLIVWERFDT
jgi:ribA/ribD-fused uncharacterized protein